MNRGKGIDKPPVLILFVSIHASERGSISLVLYYHSCLRLCGRVVNVMLVWIFYNI
jgi:hypothetical protein